MPLRNLRARLEADISEVIAADEFLCAFDFHYHLISQPGIYPVIGIRDTGCWKRQAPGVSTFEVQILCLVFGFLFGGLICQFVK